MSDSRLCFGVPRRFGLPRGGWFVRREGRVFDNGTNKLSGGRYDECTEAILGAPFFAVEEVEYWNEESERLAATGGGGCEDVFALEGEGDALGLDIGHVDKMSTFETALGVLRDGKVSE